MDMRAEIRAAASDPAKLEQLYQTARQAGQADLFRAAMLACYAAAPDNLLYAAWFHRLKEDESAPRRGVNWTAAIPLSILTGLITWALSDAERLVVMGDVPLLFLLWSLIATMSALAFLTLTSRKDYRRALALGLGLAATAAYAALITPRLGATWLADQYRVLALIHIPLLCWIALGIATLGVKSGTADRFAFLIKSIEVIITAGLYLIAGMALGGITLGMFDALGIELPPLWLRMIAAGGAGLLPVLALATAYDPTRSPAAQDFDTGLSKLIATMMRLLLPLTLAVLVVYIFVIPFNFLAPYRSREVLIVYNLMLFAILGLLIGATPIQTADLSPGLQRWLRTGIIAVAILATLVSLYALSATVTRTLQGSLTPNRLTIIGWNTINIGILAWLVYRQRKADRRAWVEALQRTFSLATNAYLAWTLFLLIGMPLLMMLLH
jgi:hypothetical protein